jgi:hypothetical protein
VQAGTRIGGLIELQNTEIKKQIKAAILRNIEEFRTDKGYIIPTPSLIVTASKTAHNKLETPGTT